MPGIIESGEPPEGGGGITSWSEIVVQEAAAPPSAEEIEDFADRLRFMGLTDDVVAEFEQRASEDYYRAVEWVSNMLEARPQPPEWACDCGEQLVPDDWRGQATVRCDKCGSRWGLIVDESNGGEQWCVSGPTDEWLAKHPDDEPGLYEDHPPEEVIGDGLPPMVEGIEPGRAFPLASYRVDRWAAVLYVVRHELTEFDLPGDEYGYEIEELSWDEADGWVNVGSSGSGWVNPFSPPRALLDKYVVLGTGQATTCDDTGCFSLTGGLCSSAVHAIQLDADGVQTRSPIDPARPIFLVGTLSSPAVLRFFDHDGQALRDHRGKPVEVRIQDDDFFEPL